MTLFRRFRTLVCAAALTGFSIGSLHAEYLALYDFEGEWLNSYAAPTGATASNFFWQSAPVALTSVSQALKGDKSPDPFPTDTATGFNGWDYNALSFRSLSANGGSEAGAVAGGHYVGFTITPEEDITLNLSLLEFKLSMSGTSGANTFFVRSSLDDYGTTLLTGTITTSYQKFSLNLAELGFVNLGDAVQFRIYFYSPGETPSASAYNYVDKVLLQGTTAIPEPNTVALLAGAGMLGLMSKRRHSRIRRP